MEIGMFRQGPSIYTLEEWRGLVFEKNVLQKVALRS